MTYFNINNFRNSILPEEKHITKSWTGSTALVSVICTTYNHAAYVEDALRGFLTQQTTFPFEIIVHDDASTDETQSIVRAYALAYPKIIKTIFQQQNQHSQGVKIIMSAARFAVGEFIALCEGDDYWIDNEKLQTQVDALLALPKCEMCFHSAVVTKKEVIQDTLFCRRSRGNHHFIVGPIIRGGGSFMPTASMMIRKSFFDRAFADQGTFYKRYMTGYFYQIHCSLEDGAYYIDRPMSVYRSFSEGSWTQRISQDQTMYRRWLLNYLESLRETDKMTGHAYSDDIMISIRRCHLSVLNKDTIDMAFRRDYFNQYRNELGFWGEILWYGVFSMPTNHAVVRRIRTLIQMLRKQLTKFGR